MFQANLKDLLVVIPYSNTCRYRRRQQLGEQFVAMVKASGVDYILVEIALGDRPFEITKPGTNDLQLRTVDEFFHKENGIRLGIQRGRTLFPGKKMVAYIDADCAPVGRSFQEWMEETWHQLQHYEAVQMWEWLQPLDINLNPLGSPSPSFISNYIKFGTPYPKPGLGYPNQWGSPGLAWAFNLSAYDQIGGIPDAHPLGSGDWYLAHMMIGEIKDIPDTNLAKYTADFRNYWLNYQVLCDRWIRRDVGFVPGLYTHFFHGKIVNRGYNTRDAILIDNKFSQLTDLKRDSQGLWQIERIEPRQIKMYDQIRGYMRQRNEDSIDS